MSGRCARAHRWANSMGHLGSRCANRAPAHPELAIPAGRLPGSTRRPFASSCRPSRACRRRAGGPRSPVPSAGFQDSRKAWTCGRAAGHKFEGAVRSASRVRLRLGCAARYVCRDVQGGSLQSSALMSDAGFVKKYSRKFKKDVRGVSQARRSRRMTGWGNVRELENDHCGRATPGRRRH